MTLLQYLMTGLLIGGVYALMSVGLALIFGVMKVVNVAQSDFMMLGMYFTSSLYSLYGIHPVVGTLLAIPCFYVLGIVFYRVFLIRVSGPNTMGAQLLLTLGLSFLITNGVAMLLGPTPRGMVTPWATAAFHVHGMLLNQAHTYAFAVALLLSSALYLLLQHSDLGRAIRAAADEPEAAMYMGINVRRMYTIACGLGIALTALAGGLLATFWPLESQMSGHWLILMFVTVGLGGLGSLPGSFVGGLIIGMVQSLSPLVMPLQLQNVGVLVIFLLILFLRPQGLLGRRGRVV